MNPATVFPSEDSFAHSILNRYTVKYSLFCFHSIFYFRCHFDYCFIICTCRKWKLASLYSWVIFLVYEISISIQSYTAAKPICAIIPIELASSFYYFACAAAVSGFLFTFMMLSVRISSMMPGQERVPSLMALDVVLKGLLCSLAFFLFKWNGICIDVLG